MGYGTGFAIFFIIWWVMIFITLPFGMRSQIEAGEVQEGTEGAAPADPQIFKRMIWNTVLSLIVFGLYWFVFYYLDYGLEDLPDFFTRP